MAVVAVRSASVQPLLDVAVPVLLAVLTVTQLLTDEPRANAALVTVCALAAVLPLAVRRRRPAAGHARRLGRRGRSGGGLRGRAGHLRLVRRGDDLRLHAAPARGPSVRSRPGSA